MPAVQGPRNETGAEQRRAEDREIRRLIFRQVLKERCGEQRQAEDREIEQFRSTQRVCEPQAEDREIRRLIFGLLLKETPGEQRRVCKPQAVYHFTRKDQVNALVDARNSEPEIGFMMRLLALCTLPRTDPGECDRYVKTNGFWSLVMVASGTEPHLPYGTLPRLILAWICSEAVRTKSQTLTLGQSFSDFMRSLDLQVGGGGPRSDRRRLEIQMERLFRASVELSDRRENGVYRVADHITTASDLWWNPKRPGDPVGTIELGAKFFQEIVECPVPIDMTVLKAMKRSSLGLDLYLWLTYKLFCLKQPQALDWVALHRQFAKNPSRDPRILSGFRRDVLRELRKIHTAWPGFRFETPRGKLRLLPTPPQIPVRARA